jgi:hypothetical protein
MKEKGKMKETIKSLNPLNISIFLPVLQGLHGKIRGSKMRAGWSPLRAGGTKMCAAARQWHKNARPCAPLCAKTTHKPHLRLKNKGFSNFANMYLPILSLIASQGPDGVVDVCDCIFESGFLSCVINRYKNRLFTR